MTDRSSQAEEPNLITDPTLLAEKEAENALAQYDWAMQQLDKMIEEGPRALKLSLVLDLNRLALKDIHPYAGNFRPASVKIIGSDHQPISSEDVPRYVEEMLDYVVRKWEDSLAVHLAAYVLWRLNWIHPFSDGNGRTARMLSYMVLCGKLGFKLPGANTIPEQISENKKPYYTALEAADAHYKEGTINLSEMEQMLEGHLAVQLLRTYEGATGVRPEVDSQPEDLPDRQNEGRAVVRTVENHPVIAGGIFLIIATILTIFLT